MAKPELATVYFWPVRVFRVASKICEVAYLIARNSLSNACMLEVAEEVIPVLQASVLFHAQPFTLHEHAKPLKTPVKSPKQTCSQRVDDRSWHES